MLDLDQEIVLLDLFSGVGGFSKGFIDAGLKIKTHYFSEVDKHAIAVYKHNFKNSIYAGDVRTVSRETIPERPNIITFGFPCQDLSVAGKGKGLSGSRSGLFFEAIRIIEEFKPEVFVFENVKGLLSSHNGKDFETVLRTIADIGIYECEWQLVNTAWLLPQNRERIYFVGHLAGRSKPRVFPFRKSDKEFDCQRKKNEGQEDIAWSLRSRDYKDGTNFVLSNSGLNRKFEEREILPPLRSNTSAGNNDFVVMPVITPDRMNKRQNGRRFKEDGEPAFTLNTQDRHGVMINKNNNLYSDDLYYDITYFIFTFDDINNFIKNGKEIKNNTREILRILRQEIGEKSFAKWRSRIFNTFQQEKILQPKLYEEILQRELERECIKTARKLQSQTNIQEKRHMLCLWEREENGNTSQGQKQIEQRFNELTRSLQELPYKTGSYGEILHYLWKEMPRQELLYETLSKIQKIWRSTYCKRQPVYETKIRRLTEREAELLQGFPDNWTEYGNYDGKVKKVSKTQRYRQMGNAVTTLWPKMIMERLMNK